MILLDYPAWLLLLVPALVVLFAWRMPSRLLTALRAVLVALVVLAMAAPVLRYRSGTGVVVVVVDRSLSMPHETDRRARETIGLLHDAMRSGDGLAVVAFGKEAVVEQPPQPSRFNDFVNQLDRDGSDLAAGIDAALSLIPPGAPGRILVLSDGRWTGSRPVSAVSRATAAGVPVDYRLMERSTTGDIAVGDIEVPDVVGPGSAYFITARVESPRPQRIRYRLVRDERVIASGEREVSAGSNRLTFRDVAPGSGTGQYRLDVVSADDAANGIEDPVPENNSARFMVGVRSPRPLLHVVQSTSGLGPLLNKGGLDVVTLPASQCRWEIQDLARYTGVILENVPAQVMPGSGMENVAAWVRETGAGLMFTGGKSSYGPGGYYKSALDPIMPVSMELRTEHRKLRLAIAVVLDRSGSMGAGVAGGKTKMDLANLGAAEVLSMMSSDDEFGCLAVDSSPHTVVPLGRVGSLGDARRKVLGIQSGGGGIFVFTGLKAAVAMLSKASAGTRHIILFSDAADSEEPGQYKLLLEKLQRAGITVSVIGLGRKTDSDAPFIIDVARRGNGRIFFTDQPTELPRLFAQDTFSVARSTFITEATPVKTTPLLRTLTSRGLQNVPNLGGYNLCYIKKEANQGVISQDEYKAPIVSWWQAGTGRVLCYAGEADGEYTGPIAGWPDVGTFMTSMARWTAGDPRMLPGNMLVTQTLRGGVLRVKLELDPQRKTPNLRRLPQVTIMRGQPGQSPEVQKAPMTWDSPDSLSLDILLDGTETVLATVDVEGAGRAVMWPTCLPYSPEFRPADIQHGAEVLAGLARATGGVNRAQPDAVWKDLKRKYRYVSLKPWLLAAALTVFLLEVLQRRTGALVLLGRAMVRRRRREVERPNGQAESTTKVKRRRRKPATAEAAEGSATGPAGQPADAEKADKPEPARPPARAAMLDAMKQIRKRSDDRNRR